VKVTGTISVEVVVTGAPVTVVVVSPLAITRVVVSVSVVMVLEGTVTLIIAVSSTVTPTVTITVSVTRCASRLQAELKMDGANVVSDAGIGSRFFRNAVSLEVMVSVLVAFTTNNGTDVLVTVTDGT